MRQPSSANLDVSRSTRLAMDLGVVYQIYPRSFRDTDGDGVGDLEGIRRGVDYLSWLGIDAVWLSPIYPSPMADFGYDVADYTAVDPVFGTLADVDRLIDELSANDIRLLLDWVPNHTSDHHPWFKASRSSPDDPKRNWYLWRDPAPDGGPPNNWAQRFADGPAWTFDENSGQYYLHLFLPQQPDLNWSNPEVRAAMHDVLRFWLDRGVAGFRADVVHLIGKDADLDDDPPELEGTPRVSFHDVDVTMSHLAGIRDVLDEYDAPMVGEVNLPDPARVARYVGDDRLPMAFFFGLLTCAWDAVEWQETIRESSGHFDAAGVWPVWALGNHDQPRMRTRYGSLARARAAAVVLLTLRGTPFLYAGDELGLADAEVPDDRVIDPGGRDGCRAPFPWDGSMTHGWATDTPWLPWPPHAEAHNVAEERRSHRSTLHLYRRLIELRRRSKALALGSQEILDVDDRVLAYRRVAGDDVRLVLVNFGLTETAVEAGNGWMVDVSSDRVGEGVPFAGRLAADTAVVLRAP